MRTLINDECDHGEEEFEENEEPQVITHPEFRVTALYGDVDVTNSRELLASMLVMKEKSANPETGVMEYRPFDFYISTPGGNASDMFAIYDMMCQVRSTTPIHTIGIGKVMSAGVLWLAAGTKGERRIGKNCRVMIHAASASYYGTTNIAHNQLKEVQRLETMLIEALSDETKMSKKFLKDVFDKDQNYYLSAKEAIKLGIVDELIQTA